MEWGFRWARGKPKPGTPTTLNSHASSKARPETQYELHRKEFAKSRQKQKSLFALKSVTSCLHVYGEYK